jgi:histidine triad (HIT) family protein
MEKTVFQKIIDRELPGTIRYEDDQFIIIDSIDPRATTHCLVIPKKVISSIADITEDDREVIGKLFVCAVSFIRGQHLKDFKLVLNGGRYLHVPHLHLHILAGDMGDIRDS